MDLTLAFTHLTDALKEVPFLDEVLTEEREPGANDYRATLLLGNTTNFWACGRIKKREQALRLILNVKGTLAQTENIMARCKAITDAVLADPRRGGNAQFTTISGWSVDSQGRNGAQLWAQVVIGD